MERGDIVQRYKKLTEEQIIKESKRLIQKSDPKVSAETAFIINTAMILRMLLDERPELKDVFMTVLLKEV